jgi:hypothetical protein
MSKPSRFAWLTSDQPYALHLDIAEHINVIAGFEGLQVRVATPEDWRGNAEDRSNCDAGRSIGDA